MGTSCGHIPRSTPRPSLAGVLLLCMGLCLGAAGRPALLAHGTGTNRAAVKATAGPDVPQPVLADRQDVAPAAGVLAGETAGKDVPILMYHYLSSGPAPSVYHVSAGMFRRQLAALAAYGYQTVSIQDFLAYRAGSATPPARPVILTFDDGERGVYDIARPALLAAGMRATLCVTTGWLGATAAERLAGWLVWAPEIQQLYADGFPIESHSIIHPVLTELSPGQAWQEIWGSRLAIQDRLGNTVRVFCYPSGFGAYDEPVRDLVREAGYQAALAAWPDGIANTAGSDVWALPRLMIGETNSVDLDPAHPENFFMRKLDPAFPLPSIELGPLQSRAAGGARRGCFLPGEAITIQVTAQNHGSPARVWVALALDDGIDHAAPYYRAGHEIELATSASLAFTFIPGAPDGRARGLHYATLDLADERQVLSFRHSGPRPAFIMADSCHSSLLPVIGRAGQ